MNLHCPAQQRLHHQARVLRRMALAESGMPPVVEKRLPDFAPYLDAPRMRTCRRRPCQRRICTLVEIRTRPSPSRPLHPRLQARVARAVQLLFVAWRERGVRQCENQREASHHSCWSPGFICPLVTLSSGSGVFCIEGRYSGRRAKYTRIPSGICAHTATPRQCACTCRCSTSRAH